MTSLRKIGVPLAFGGILYVSVAAADKGPCGEMPECGGDGPPKLIASVVGSTTTGPVDQAVVENTYVGHDYELILGDYLSAERRFAALGTGITVVSSGSTLRST